MSYPIAMASNLLAMACNLITTACNLLISDGLQQTSNALTLQVCDESKFTCNSAHNTHEGLGVNFETYKGRAVVPSVSTRREPGLEPSRQGASSEHPT